MRREKHDPDFFSTQSVLTQRLQDFFNNKIGFDSFVTLVFHNQHSICSGVFVPFFEKHLMRNTSLLLRFLLVGGSTAAINFGLTIALVEGPALQVTIASTIACIAAICYNYILHYHWTFASDAPHGRVLVRYLLMCTGGVLLNGLVMHFGVLVLSIHYMLVQLFAGVVLVCWSLCLGSLWVFRKD